MTCAARSSGAGSRQHAEAAARQAARYGGRCRYRGVCSRGDHVHVDYYNRHGQLTYTHHYNWRAQ
jgi:hypothetical protein